MVILSRGWSYLSRGPRLWNPFLLAISRARADGSGCPEKIFIHNYLERIVIIYTGCLKKSSFAELSICIFAKNIISISSQLAAGSPNAQFGKTHFFRHPDISRICEIMITMFEVGVDKEVVCGQYLDKNDLCHHVRGRGGRGNGL